MLRPGGSGGDAAYSLKAICIFPGNPALGKDAHQGVVLLSSPDTGEPQAVINASALTEIRTAAASVVATRLLARADASELAIIGTGVQARAHAIALAQDYAARGRPLAGIRIAGRTPGQRGPGGRGAHRRGRGARDGLRLGGRGRGRRQPRGDRHLVRHPRAGAGLADGGHAH